MPISSKKLPGRFGTLSDISRQVEIQIGHFRAKVGHRPRRTLETHDCPLAICIPAKGNAFTSCESKTRLLQLSKNWNSVTYLITCELKIRWRNPGNFLELFKIVRIWTYYPNRGLPDNDTAAIGIVRLA